MQVRVPIVRIKRNNMPSNFRDHSKSFAHFCTAPKSNVTASVRQCVCIFRRDVVFSVQNIFDERRSRRETLAPKKMKGVLTVSCSFKFRRKRNRFGTVAQSGLWEASGSGSSPNGLPSRWAAASASSTPVACSRWRAGRFGRYPLSPDGKSRVRRRSPGHRR